MSAKILILDIETAPNLAYVWRFWKQNIGMNMIKEDSSMLSYAAKWYGSDEVFYEDTSGGGTEKRMLKKLWPLLDEADIVVAHNGKKFDLPKIMGRMMVNGIAPHSPVKVVDTLLVSRRVFGFDANSLAYLARILKLDIQKGKHKKYPGFELWIGVLADDKEAWKEMKEYNIDDILVLEDLYTKILPHIYNHPNLGVYQDEQEGTEVCPKCNGVHLQRRGFATTNVSKFQRYRCNDCGGWSRDRINILNKSHRASITTNIT